MGWYPWNIFGEDPQNEKLIKEIVDALVASEEWAQHMVRAGMHLDGQGFVRGFTGDAVAVFMADRSDAPDDLSPQVRPGCPSLGARMTASAPLCPALLCSLPGPDPDPGG